MAGAHVHRYVKDRSARRVPNRGGSDRAPDSVVTAAAVAAKDVMTRSRGPLGSAWGMAMTEHRGIS
jgi:hypothetical protein